MPIDAHWNDFKSFYDAIDYMNNKLTILPFNNYGLKRTEVTYYDLNDE